MKQIKFLAGLIVAAFLAMSSPHVALAAASLTNDVPVIKLGLKNHVFAPQDVVVPAGQKIKLLIKNDDPTSSEFESSELGREKVLPPNSETAIFIDPLDAGTYPFVDDFHRATTTGKIIAK